jgi:hypothetical protein
MFTEPVKGSDFFDRSGFLNTLLKRSKALEDGYRQNIAVLGPENIGKTSLIFQFLLKLPEYSKSNLPVYLEITSNVPFNYLVRRFIAVFLFNLLRKHGINSGENLDELIESSQKIIPKTIGAIRRCLNLTSTDNNENVYSLTLDLPYILSEELNMPVIIILDEFHNFNRFALNNPFGTLAKKIMLQKNILYIITSSQRNLAKRILSRDLTLLFGNFEILELEPFDIKTSQDFIEHKLGAIKCSRDYRQFIIDITDGQPLYLNIISSEMQTLAIKHGLSFITDRIIIEALSNILFSPEGILNQFFMYWLNQLPLNRSPISYISILLAIGHNCLRSRQIKEFLKINSEKEFFGHLNRLLELNHIQKSGILYHLTDELFKIWLLYAYENRESSLEIDSEVKMDYFRRALAKRLNYFLKDKCRTVSERLKDLFISFGHETIYLNSKRIRLPQFQSIEIKNPQAMNPLIICKTKNKPWLFVVQKNRLIESTMEDISLNCKRLRNMYQRKIVIALDGMDENARLMAKADKFLILEAADLNRILGLFDKNKIFPDETI